jgi:hypothetical protein
MPDGAHVNSNNFKFTLLDGSLCLYVGESRVSISYTFPYQRVIMN